ncbi:MAG TPA: biopolymer transporter ExbD [Phnomibacter sp.]|nr:biopolymer transporter ExbD [Phnomibacter sp.]
MADLIVSGGQSRRRVPTPRIDLTPMVDLGFLLITFFIFTATLSTPTAITTLLPADSKDSMRIAGSGSVTLIPASNGLVYYAGPDAGAAEMLPWSAPDDLRWKLIQMQHALISTEGNDDKFFVMIKPTENTSFERVVRLLDEMKICQVKRYTLTDLNEQERQLFAGL